MKENTTKELGVATIRYNKDGKIEEIYYKPTMKINAQGIELEQLKEDLAIKENPQEDKIKQATDMVMATWFKTVNDIEMMDRASCDIKSEILSCSKYRSTDTIKTVKVKYNIVQLDKQVNPMLN